MSNFLKDGDLKRLRTTKIGAEKKEQRILIKKIVII